MTVTVYGIANCDTVKKARAWLDAQGVSYTFHDYKKRGTDASQIARWVEQAGWERVLNRAGTTFRRLPDSDKDGLDARRAVQLMVANPSAIKRPIVEQAGGLLVGFREAEWAQALRR